MSLHKVLNMKTVIQRVIDERLRQDAKWGEQNHNAIEWVAILTEEVGEASKEAVDFHFANGDVDVKLKAGKRLQIQRIEHLKKELIQAAAVAIQAVESIERQAF